MRGERDIPLRALGVWGGGSAGRGRGVWGGGGGEALSPGEIPGTNRRTVRAARSNGNPRCLEAG